MEIGIAASDIDLLVTYDEGISLIEARRIREWLANLLTNEIKLLTDICLLSDAEETEVGFVAKELAQLAFKNRD